MSLRTHTCRHPGRPASPASCRARRAGQAARRAGPGAAAAQRGAGRELGLDPDGAARPDGVPCSSATALPEGATPVAQAYAGHQFGGYSPRLGDGRALLLGELVDVRRAPARPAPQGVGPHAVRPRRRRQGRRRADAARVRRRRGDARARHPDDAALAVVATGEDVAPRDRCCPAPCWPASRPATSGSGRSSTRARTDDPRCCAASPTTPSPATTRRRRRRRTRTSRSSRRVVEAQASLVAQWMLVGFIHGVMNTDNMTISGETIDYGPCAFMDAFDPATVFSSIDHGGRYAYGNQPGDRAVEPRPARRGAAPAARRGPGHGRRDRRRGARGVPADVQRRLARRDARQARAARGRRRTARRRSSTTCSRCCRQSHVDYTSLFRALGGRCCAATASPRAALFARPPPAVDALADEWRALDPDAGRDGPGQPGLHPAQPPRRGGARRGDRRATSGR